MKRNNSYHYCIYLIHLLFYFDNKKWILPVGRVNLRNEDAQCFDFCGVRNVALYLLYVKDLACVNELIISELRYVHREIQYCTCKKRYKICLCPVKSDIYNQ